MLSMAKRKVFNIRANHLMFGHLPRFVFHAAKPKAIKDVSVGVELLATVKVECRCCKNGTRRYHGTVLEAKFLPGVSCKVCCFLSESDSKAFPSNAHLVPCC
jgi:hypothetical protein